MVAAREPQRLGATPARRRVTRRWRYGVRRYGRSEPAVVFMLAVLTLVIGAAMWQARTDVSVATIVIPIVLADLFLSPRSLPGFVLFCLAVLAAVMVGTAPLVDSREIGAAAAAFVVGLITLVAAFRRSRLGVAGSRGESMLVDLRERITRQGVLPALPADWYAEAITRSAGGSSFAGDFMVAAKNPGSDQLEVAVVDVSGKGEQAGTRSLLLSGAFGGLLGALPAEGFLPAANEYLLRQDWSEGFATAIHLSLDLSTGGFQLRAAGHPPGVQLNAGSGRWSVLEPTGPVLGLMESAEFSVVDGRFNHGDALLLFTDGLVETHQRDISSGIDRLVGHAERLLRGGFEHGARKLLDRVGVVDDDQALLLLHRR